MFLERCLFQLIHSLAMKPHHRINIAGFLMDFAVISAMTVLPFYIFNQLGKGAGVSGLIGGLQAAMYSILCLASAGIVGRAKNGMSWAYAGVIGFTFFICLLPFFRDPWICGALAVMSNGFLAFYWPAQYSWIGSEPDLELRGRRMAQFNIAWSLGFALGPLFAGPLYDIDYRLPFLVIFVLECVLFFFIVSLPHERDLFKKASAEMLEQHAEHSRASERYLLLGWAANFVANFFTSVTRMVFPKRVEELVLSGQLSLVGENPPYDIMTAGAATKYSWLAFFLSGTIMLSFMLMGRSRFWQHRASVLLISQVFAALSFWVLGQTHTLLVMVLCFMIVGANSGISFFSAIYYSVANAASKHRRSAINEGLVGGGACLGSVLFGFLAQRYGTALPFIWTPAFVAVFLLIQVPLIPRRMSPEKVQEDDGNSAS